LASVLTVNIRRVFKPAAFAAGLAALAFGGAGQAQAPGATPGFTAAQAARGQALYSANCAMCHGDGLDDGQFAPALKGPNFTAYWSGKTAADVLTYISTMMPPTDPGSLGAQGSADVLAYITQGGGGKAGDKELPTDPAALAKSAP
jgi:alcohol dehydrogenase (cytochrome c)